MCFGGDNVNFDEIFKIMDEAFPDNEMRTYDAQKNCWIMTNIIFMSKKMNLV